MSFPIEIFRVSGPSHLTTVDWKNPHHRRAIAASLVEGAYKIERDRQENRQGPQAEAPPYWEFFHFKLNHVLNDNVDHSIFGAIYEFKYPSYPHLKNDTNSPQNLRPPQYVVALRGTLTQTDTRSRDLKLDFDCICNRIHESTRVQLATQTIQNLVKIAGAGNILLAGHSLGSAIGLLVGKNMAKMGFSLETYLFNPPFISAPIERIKEERVRNGIRIAGSVMKAGLNAVVKGRHNHSSDHHHDHHNHQDKDSFSVLSAWFPYLFVNPADHICSGYIGYFEHRKKMEEIGAGGIGRFATKSSVESILSSAIMGKESEPYDLLPSAFLIVNQTPSPDFRRAHGVEQWWNPNFHYRSLTYQFTQ